MTDLASYTEPILNSGAKRPAYDSTKYQSEQTSCTGVCIKSTSNTSLDTRCDVQCTITVPGQDDDFHGHDSLSESSNDFSDVHAIPKRAPKQIVNVARLEFLKRRRSKLVSRRHRLKMLQHDLYDVLVKLQTLMSGKFTAPPEETASRLTCLVAEICTIQLEAQDIHEGVSRDGPSQQQSSERSSEHRKAVPVLSEKARQNTAADGSQHESADHAQTVARLGELILQALRSFPQAADREPALKPSSSPKASQRPRAPHGTELISDPIGTVQRRSAVSADKPQGIQQTPANEPKEIQLADSAASAARSEGASPLTAEPQAVPELTLSRWNPDSEAANAHASNSLARQLAPAAHDGLSHLEANDSPSMQRPGVRLDAGRSYHQGPSLLQSLRMSGTSFRKITSRPADSPAYSHLADQSDTETHQSGRLMRSRVPTSALHGSTVSAQQHGEEQRVSEQADLVWDGSITRVIDPEAVVRTRSGLRLRMPGRQPPAEMERPTTAGSLRPMTAVTAAGSARSFSRSRAQSDRQSRGSRRPDWDDRFILPQQHKGRGREESAAPMHTYRASTPDRVLQEGLPRRKQQHPWLSKRAVQLRGALKPPSSRRAASAPRAAESRMGSPPHMASVSRAAVQLPDSCRPPGAFGHSRGAEFAEPSRLRTEVLGGGYPPTSSSAPPSDQILNGQHLPGRSHLQAASLDSSEDCHDAGAVLRAVAAAEGGALCEKHSMQTRLAHLQEGQKPAVRMSSKQVDPAMNLGTAVSVEPLLAQLEDMEARMQTMMSTIASKLHGMQSTSQ